jgi:hypothetical protein
MSTNTTHPSLGGHRCLTTSSFMRGWNIVFEPPGAAARTPSVQNERFSHRWRLAAISMHLENVTLVLKNV